MNRHNVNKVLTQSYRPLTGLALQLPSTTLITGTNVSTRLSMLGIRECH